MDWLDYRQGRLCGDGLPLAPIAERFGTPAYVYSRAAISRAYGEFAEAAAGRRATICYAMKANSNLAIIDVLARLGAGFDIVSGGELRRVIAAGGDPRRVVFSGVGKRRDEIEAALDAGVRCFNAESKAELARLSAIGVARGQRVPISLRVNPDVDAGTHPYISTGLKDNKFGIAHADALACYREAARAPGLAVVGIDCHIGSQITDVAPYLAALDKLLELIDQLAAEGIALDHIDLGGGLGIRYRDETPPSRAVMLAALFERLDAHPRAREMEVLFEFGRALVGNAGLLLTRVEHLKDNGERHFAIIDAAMNDLLRPSLYQAYHAVLPLSQEPSPKAVRAHWDLVGPVCESGDWLARDRELPLAEGDLLAVCSAGAYGMVMASNYNSRPRPVELLIDDGQVRVVRERESIDDLWRGEHRLPD